jgi:photosynthetic reaction center H subunit
MPTGAITSHIDVAQIALYLFWAFFLVLVLYLHREGKREGYPLVSDRADASGGRVTVEGFPGVPEPKTFLLHTGGSVTVPTPVNERPLAAKPTDGFPGAALAPTGDPMQDGVGPAAWALRADVPDMTYDDHVPKIVPLRVAKDFHLAEEDPDPRGMKVLGADDVVAGTIVDAWVDRSEILLRYLEAEVPTEAGTKRVLVPMPLCRITYNAETGASAVHVRSVLAKHFATAPTTKVPEQITLLEEDRVSAYFGGGNMYATPERERSVI